MQRTTFIGIIVCVVAGLQASAQSIAPDRLHVLPDRLHVLQDRLGAWERTLSSIDVGNPSCPVGRGSPAPEDVDDCYLQQQRDIALADIKPLRNILAHLNTKPTLEHRVLALAQVISLEDALFTLYDGLRRRYEKSNQLSLGISEDARLSPMISLLASARDDLHFQLDTALGEIDREIEAGKCSTAQR
jgi:hypothetical protein